MLPVALPFALVVSLVAAASPQAPPPRVAEWNRQIESDLAGRDTLAAGYFRHAVAAADGGDPSAAESLYGLVLKRVPGYPHALRRLSYYALARGDRLTALRMAGEAVARDSSSANLSALAYAISAPQTRFLTTPEQRAEAVGVARLAVSRDPTDIDALYRLCEVGIAADSGGAVIEAADRLDRLHPRELQAYFFEGLAFAARGDLRRAEARIEEARGVGLPDSTARAILASWRRVHERGPARYVVPATIVLGAWIVGLLLLFVIGGTLSRLTLRQAEALAGRRDPPESGAGSRLRSLYRSVLHIACAYYYLSVPMVIALVLAAAGGIYLGFMALNVIPIKLVALVAILAIVTVFSIFRSLFTRSRVEDPGERVDLEAHPKLRTLLDEVAERIGTRAVDHVYMTPGTDLAVMERGSLMHQLRGTTERCLILGAGVLEGMKLRALRAILGHEYGHFSNRDTAGGGFALAVRRSLMTMAMGIARGGAAAWYNPAWLFINAYYRIFLRISQGASRLQEVLADRWAAFAYGSAAFDEGLRHVISRSERFGAFVNVSIQDAATQKRPMANLYRYQPKDPPSESDLATRVESILNQEPTPYDSHPAPRDRLAWVDALAIADPDPASDGERDAWSLFPDRKEIEEKFTAEVLQRLRERHGVDIPEAESASPPDTPAAPGAGGAPPAGAPPEEAPRD